MINHKISQTKLTATRMEHCMHCGQVVTVKEKESTVFSSRQISKFHFHCPVSDQYGWKQVLILCAPCLNISEDKCSSLVPLLQEKFEKLGLEKKVNKNLGFSVLAEVFPAIAQEVRDYFAFFNYTLLDNLGL